MRPKRVRACRKGLVLALAVVGCNGSTDSGALPPAEIVPPQETTLSLRAPAAIEVSPTLAQSSEFLAEAALWERLQQAEGVYVVLMRHALAPGTGDSANF
jgi:hypothetical protein